jgi:hypothetical protein
LPAGQGPDVRAPAIHGSVDVQQAMLATSVPAASGSASVPATMSALLSGESMFESASAALKSGLPIKPGDWF